MLSKESLLTEQLLDARSGVLVHRDRPREVTLALGRLVLEIVRRHAVTASNFARSAQFEALFCAAVCLLLRHLNGD